MMNKLVSILILLLVLFAGWKLFEYWQETRNEPATANRETLTPVAKPDELPGMPYELQPSLDAAEQQGAAALQNWLKTYNGYLQDPRRAWIELDYCVMIAHQNPSAAKRIFGAVKARTPPSSPVWPRLQQLEKSYE